MAVLLQRGARMEAGDELSGMRWGNLGQGKRNVSGDGLKSD
jgi:hypothetical protein